MPHGGPDWSTGGQISTVHTVEDLGELAARLGSIVTFDRRGNIIFLDDFESGIEKWTHESFAGGEGLAWSSIHARNGDFSAKLTTDDHTNDDAVMIATIPYPALSQIGFEFSFLRDSYLKQITIAIELETGADVVSAGATWTAATKTWTVTDKDGAVHNLTPTITLGIDYPMFFTVKLVADFINRNYIRLIINNTEFNLSGITLPVSAPGPSPKLQGFIVILTNSNDVCSLYVDDVIVTQNEP